MKKSSKRLLAAVCLIGLLILAVTLLTGCKSTDKSESYMRTADIESATCVYNAEEDTTKVTWRTTLSNNTIYNINGFSVTFEFYNDGVLLREGSVEYSRKVKHGDDYTGNFTFHAKGKVDKIAYVSWNADYASLWDTYKIWFIVMICLSAVGSVVYIIFMIIEDLDLSETFENIVDFFEDNGWLLWCLLISMGGGTVWGIVSSYWVPLLIVLGGILAFVAVSLLAHLIKFIVESITDDVTLGSRGKKSTRKRNYFEDDENYADMEDYLNDKDGLMNFSVEDLKHYCRENGIRGYSSLNKSELADLIMNENSKDDNKAKNKAVSNNRKKETANKITFADIAGLEEAKTAFKEKVVFGLKHRNLYEKYGKKVGGGLLLYGLPGTGKTMFAEAAANETDALFIPIKCSDIKSKWYGESESNVKGIFDRARKAKKAMIFFDEFEAIGAKRTDSENGNNDLVPQILAEMQGVGSHNNDCIIIVIAATNKPWSIDSAFLRPGRFDEKIYIPLPDFAARKELFRLKLSSVPQTDLDYDYLASVTEGFNGADVGAFCDKLKMAAINKSIETGKECPITMEEVGQVKGIVKSSVMKEDIESLEEFEKQYS